VPPGVPDWAQVRSLGPARFLDLAEQLHRIRRRTGATSWRLYRDTANANTLVESFVLGSWAEHDRQHARISQRDDALIDRLETMTINGRSRSVEHYLAAGRHGASMVPR
jgi:Transmembrane secretion effector